MLPDGRMHIAVEGGERFRLLELHHDRSFLEGTVEAVADEDDPPASARRRAGARRSSGRLQAIVGSTLEPPSADSPLLDFEIVSRVDFGNDEKQELIELTSPHRRYARLVELLEHALEALTLERAVHAVGGRRTARSRRSAATSPPSVRLGVRLRSGASPSGSRRRSAPSGRR